MKAFTKVTPKAAFPNLGRLKNANESIAFFENESIFVLGSTSCSTGKSCTNQWIEYKLDMKKNEYSLAEHEIEEESIYKSNCYSIVDANENKYLITVVDDVLYVYILNSINIELVGKTNIELSAKPFSMQCIFTDKLGIVIVFPKVVFKEVLIFDKNYVFHTVKTPEEIPDYGYSIINFNDELVLYGGYSEKEKIKNNALIHLSIVNNAVYCNSIATIESYPVTTFSYCFISKNKMLICGGTETGYDFRSCIVEYSDIGSLLKNEANYVYDKPERVINQPVFGNMRFIFKQDILFALNAWTYDPVNKRYNCADESIYYMKI